MTRSKKLLILLAVLVCCIAVFLLGSHFLSDSTQESGTQIASFETGKLESIRWIYDGSEIELTARDNSWIYPADADFPLDYAKAATMASTVSTINAVKKVADDPEDLSKYGIDDPTIRLYVTAEGKTTEFDIGDYNSSSGYYYLMRSDDPALYYVDASLYETFAVKLLDLVEFEYLPETEIEDVSSLTVESGGKTLTAVYEPDGKEGAGKNEVYFIDGTNTPCNAETVTAMIGGFLNVSWNSCEAYNVTQEDLAQYGLDKPTATFSIRYHYTASDESESGGETDLEGNDALLIGSKTDDEENATYYAMIRGGKCVYTISEDTAKLYMITDETSLYSGTLLDFTEEELASLCVVYKDTTYDITAGSDGEVDEYGEAVAVTYKWNDREIPLSSFVSMLSGLKAQSVQTTDVADIGDLLLSVTVSLQDGTQQTIEIYEFDTDCCAVRFGDRTRYFADESECDDLYDAFKDALKSMQDE